MKISGMHCEHCVQSVTNAINSIDGAAAKVNLKEKMAVVSFNKEIDDTALVQVIEQAGFQVVAIEA